MVGSNWSGNTVPGASVLINTNSPNPTVLGLNGPAIGRTLSLVMSGAGSLTIQNGSTLTTTGTAASLVGGAGGVTTTLTVTGAGSQWNVTTSKLTVSSTGTAVLNIQDGGRVAAQNGVVLGSSASGSGTLDVSGSTLQVTAGQLVVGQAGTGIVNIGDGGQVIAEGGVVLGNASTASSTVNISGGGILATTSLAGGTDGTRQLDFDNATLRALGSNANFISNLSAAQMNIAAGGLTVDTNGFAIGGLGFSGVGGLKVTGNGTFTLGDANSYAGATTIDAGTLTGGVANAFSAASATTVNATGTLDLGGFAQTINAVSLAGGTLTNGSLTGAVTSAGGTINGLGGAATVTTTGGITSVTGSNAYTGVTMVNGGLLTVNGDITSSSVTVNNGGTLGGNGIVGDTTINAGGALAPGNSIGLLTVQGSLVFAAMSSYMVRGLARQCRPDQCDGNGEPWRRHRECALRGRELCREAVHDPQCHGRSRRQHVQ